MIKRQFSWAMAHTPTWFESHHELNQGVPYCRSNAISGRGIQMQMIPSQEDLPAYIESAFTIFDFLQYYIENQMADDTTP